MGEWVGGGEGHGQQWKQGSSQRLLHWLEPEDSSGWRGCVIWALAWDGPKDNSGNLGLKSDGTAIY